MAEHLFASSSSEERKYWGFLLFQQLVKSASVKSLPALFTPNFKRCLINQLASKDRYLHRAAEKSVKSIFSRVETEPSAARAPLESLSSVSLDGHLSFDQLTKSKTLERLVSLADDKSLCDIGYRLMHKFGHPGIQDERDTTAKRQVIADELTLVVKSPQSSHTGDDIDVDMRSLIDIIIQAVVKWAYFSPDASKGHREDVPKPPVSSKTQDMLRARLASWLSHIIAKAPNPGYFAYMAITTIRLKESNDAWHSNIDLTGLARKSMHGAWHVVQDVQTRLKKEPTDKAFLEAFQLLYSLTILQVYNGDADAVSMLDELHSCYDLKVSGQSNVDQGGSEILIEILLGLLAKPSQLFKRLARQVFCTCTSDINGNGLNSMIKVRIRPPGCCSS